MSARSRRSKSRRRPRAAPVASAPALPLLGPWLTDVWLPAVRPAVRPTTFASYASTVRAYLVPRLGGIPLDGLTPPAINACYGSLLADPLRPLAPLSVVRVHAVLRRALRDAVRWGILERNPALGADPPRARAREMQPWDAAEVARFLVGARADPYYELWLFFLLTGVRRGEALALRWSDVDLGAARATIRRALLVVDHKPQIGEPKSARGRRTIALDGHLVGALAALRKRQADNGRGQSADLVFAHSDGSAYHPEQVTRWFARAVRRAGVRPARLHDTRHAHATLALAAGIDTRIVSARLGHGQVSITADIYQHALPGLDRHAADKIAGIVFSQPPLAGDTDAGSEPPDGL